MSIPEVIKTFDLDLTYKKNLDVPAITVVREDAGTTKFTITIKNNGTPVDLTDLTSRIYFLKSDGTETQGDPTIDDAVNGVISYSLQSNDTAAEGDTLCQIIITDGTGNQISTFTFKFNVQQSIYDDAAVESTTEFTSLSLLADNLRHKGPYDAGTTYYTNNIVEYNGSSYIALQTSVGQTPPIYPITCTDYWCVMANGYEYDAQYAANVDIADAGGHYSSTNVENVLQEIGASLSSKETRITNLEYVRINEITSTSYTFASTDNNTFMAMNSTDAQLLIIPNSTDLNLEKGFGAIAQRMNTGSLTVSYTTTIVSMKSAGDLFSASEEGSVIGVVKRSTADDWSMFGDRA